VKRDGLAREVEYFVFFFCVSPKRHAIKEKIANAQDLLIFDDGLERKRRIPAWHDDLGVHICDFFVV